MTEPDCSAVNQSFPTGFPTRMRDTTGCDERNAASPMFRHDSSTSQTARMGLGLATSALEHGATPRRGLGCSSSQFLAAVLIQLPSRNQRANHWQSEEGNNNNVRAKTVCILAGVCIRMYKHLEDFASRPGHTAVEGTIFERAPTSSGQDAHAG